MLQDAYGRWTSQASHYIGECFDLARPTLEEGFAGFLPLVRFVAAQLLIDCNLSSESALLLVREEKEWDADLISRAVLEGTLKFRYMLLGTPGEIATKVEEYWYILPAFAAVRRSTNAQRILKGSPRPPSETWRAFRELAPAHPREAAIRERYSNAERRRLERRWSFTGICRAFDASDDAALGRMASLAHGYGMSSHLLHKDGDGVGMVWERYQREPERQRAVRLAHAARIVSDICTFAHFRSAVALSTSGSSTLPVRDLHAQYQRLFAELENAGNAFAKIEYRDDVPTPPDVAP